ncbi:MAG TPA: hypothetical protein VII70_08090 [Steroidobacteraceae bacterium]
MAPRFGVFFSVPPIAPLAHLDVTAQKAAHTTFVDLHSIGAWIFVA